MCQKIIFVQRTLKILLYWTKKLFGFFNFLLNFGYLKVHAYMHKCIQVPMSNCEFQCKTLGNEVILATFCNFYDSFRILVDFWEIWKLLRLKHEILYGPLTKIPIFKGSLFSSFHSLFSTAFFLSLKSPILEKHTQNRQQSKKKS